MRPRLPEQFCWTRFGTEAGETIESILLRKESERRANGGVFLWGIGNAIGPSMRELIVRSPEPEVIFSPIRSAPKKQDVTPESVRSWSVAHDLEGSLVPLPPGSKVTSRVSAATRHYALVCFSDEPLLVDENPATFTVGCLKNLVTGAKVGASQVTAVVQFSQEAVASGPAYPVAIRTQLVAPYFLELREPYVIETASPLNKAEAHRLAHKLRDPKFYTARTKRAVNGLTVERGPKGGAA